MMTAAMMTAGGARKLAWAIGAVGVVFGLMTLVAGGSVVFDIGTARADHGSYVPFVLTFNFLSGFVYIAAGIGVLLERRWAAAIAGGLTIGIALTTVALWVHVLSGGAYERETLVAMGVRLALWLGIFVFAWKRPRR